jgi:hypothetical protein
MVSAKKPHAAPAEKPAEFVLVPFAYATAKDGEVVQLVKGGIVNASRFRPESIEHLRSIGFIGSKD